MNFLVVKKALGVKPLNRIEIWTTSILASKSVDELGLLAGAVVLSVFMQVGSIMPGIGIDPVVRGIVLGAYSSYEEND